MSYNLTTGATGRLVTDPDSSGSYKPTMQFITIKKVVPTEGKAHTQDRYRSVLSDGATFVQAMLATQLNQLVEDGTIVQNSVITVDSWAVNEVNNPSKGKYVFQVTCIIIIPECYLSGINFRLGRI